MRRFLFLIVSLVLSPIIVLAREGNVELSYNVQASINFIDEYTVIVEKVNNGEKLIEPSHAKKQGYIFLGWFNGDERWDFENDVVTSHLTLNAKYAEENNVFFDRTDFVNNFLESSISFDCSDIDISNEEKEYLADGHILNIWLEINDINDYITNDEKNLINRIRKKENLAVDYYLDIALYKQVNDVDDTKKQIYNTNDMIKVSLTLSEKMRNKNRKYHIIRLHDGIAEEIYSGFPNENLELVFETNRFSTYVIAHSISNDGTNPSTSDNINSYMCTLVISYSVLISLLFWKNREI